MKHCLFSFLRFRGIMLKSFSGHNLLEVDMGKNIIKVARGLEQADLVLKNATILNVFTEELLPGDVAIVGNKIAGIGEYYGDREIDCSCDFFLTVINQIAVC